MHSISTYIKGCVLHPQLPAVKWMRIEDYSILCVATYEGSCNDLGNKKTSWVRSQSTRSKDSWCSKLIYLERLAIGLQQGAAKTKLLEKGKRKAGYTLVVPWKWLRKPQEEEEDSSCTYPRPRPSLLQRKIGRYSYNIHPERAPHQSAVASGSDENKRK